MTNTCNRLVCSNVECRKALEEAEAICPRTPEWRAKFETLPDNAEELEDKIAESEARLEGITLNNPGVMKEFRERQKKITDLKKRLEDTTTWLEAQQANMQEIRVRLHAWLCLPSSHSSCLMVCCRNCAHCGHVAGRQFVHAPPLLPAKWRICRWEPILALCRGQ